MTAAIANTPPDPLQQFLNPPDNGKVYELVDGQLVELEMSPISSWVASQISRLIGNFLNHKAVWAG